MIRRLLWFLLGAAIGITGYRKVTRLARSVSPGARARELGRFAGDVREGMQIYMARQPARPGPTLGTQHKRPELPGRTDDAEDGR